MTNSPQRADVSAVPREKLTVLVFTSQGVFWEGAADMVSSVNSQGAFDILPQHAKFITLVEREQIKVTLNDIEKVFVFESSVISVNENMVTIYTDFDSVINAAEAR